MNNIFKELYYVKLSQDILRILVAKLYIIAYIFNIKK